MFMLHLPDRQPTPHPLILTLSNSFFFLFPKQRRNPLASPFSLLHFYKIWSDEMHFIRIRSRYIFALRNNFEFSTDSTITIGSIRTKFRNHLHSIEFTATAKRLTNVSASQRQTVRSHTIQWTIVLSSIGTWMRLETISIELLISIETIYLFIQTTTTATKWRNKLSKTNYTTRCFRGSGSQLQLIGVWRFDAFPSHLQQIGRSEVYGFMGESTNNS